MSYSFSNDSTKRISKPFMESTRLLPSSPNVNKDGVENEEATKENLNISSNFLNDSVPGGDTSSILYAKEPLHLQKELNGLNNRLLTYMDRVKNNEALISEKERALSLAEEQVQKVRSETSQQISMLRHDISEAIRRAVLAEQREAEKKMKLDEAQLQIDLYQKEVSARRKREGSLERALFNERNSSKYLKEELAQMNEQNSNEKAQKEKLQGELTQLKLELASSQENAKIAAFELTMQENKVSETERKLQYTSEDVVRKLNEQRIRLEKSHSAVADQLRQKHRSELEKMKKDFQKKMQDTLATYVSSEEFAKLDTSLKGYMREAAEAKESLALRDEQLKACKEQVEQMRDSHLKDLANEKKRRERLNKRLLLQSRSHEDIRQELDTYRKLIESLDVGGDIVTSSPAGIKRARTSMELPTPTKTEFDPLEKSIEGTPKSLEARRILLKRALTPKKTRRDFFFGLI